MTIWRGHETQKEGRLEWIDILTLYAIVRFKPDSRQLFYTTADYSLVNDLVKKIGVDPIIGKPMVRNDDLIVTLRKLRQLGFITEKGKPVATLAGKRFLDKLGDNPHRWPMSVPFADSANLNWRGVEYL